MQHTSTVYCPMLNSSEIERIIGANITNLSLYLCKIYLCIFMAMLFRIFHSCYLGNYNLTIIDLLTKSLCIEIVSLVDCVVQRDLPLLFTLS